MKKLTTRDRWKVKKQIQGIFLVLMKGNHSICSVELAELIGCKFQLVTCCRLFWSTWKDDFCEEPRREYREIGVQFRCNFLLTAESGWYAWIEFYKLKTDSIRVNLKNTEQTSKIDFDLYLLTRLILLRENHLRALPVVLWTFKVRS